MKILMVSREPNSYNNDLFNQFASKGYCLDVVYLVSRSPNNAVWLENFERKYTYKIVTSFLNQATILLKKIRTDCSAVIIAGWATPGCLMAIFYCLMFNIKFFIWADTLSGAAPNSILVRLFRYPIRYLVITKCRAILTTGISGRSSFEKLGCHPGKIVDFPYTVDQRKLINNSICKTDISKNVINISKNRPIIFYAGQLIYRKGLDILLKALKFVIDDGYDVLLVIEGDGPLRKTYENMASELRLENNIVFVGFNQPIDHSSLLGLSNIVVVPSRWDPWGNLVHEAMVLGKVVISSNGVCSSKDRIKTGVNGFNYEAEDIYSLYKLIYKCLSNPKLMEKIEREARATALTWPVDRGLDNLKLIIESN